MTCTADRLRRPNAQLRELVRLDGGGRGRLVPGVLATVRVAVNRDGYRQLRRFAARFTDAASAIGYTCC